MKTITVEIQQLHIDVGSFCSSGTCACALAVDDALGYGGPEDRRAVEIAFEGEVNKDNIPRFGIYQGLSYQRIADLPQNVCEWIWEGDLDFENHGQAYAAERRKPITFELTFTKEPLK